MGLLALSQNCHIRYHAAFTHKLAVLRYSISMTLELNTHPIHEHHEAMYGDVAHPDTIHGESSKFEFNGVPIPAAVIQQLKMLLGDNLHSMSDHEIDKAYMNFAANGEVIRDHNGGDLHDMMHLHWGEEEPNHWQITAPTWHVQDDEEDKIIEEEKAPRSFVAMLNPLHAMDKSLHMAFGF